MSVFSNRKAQTRDRDRIIRDNMQRLVILYPPEVIEQTRRKQGAAAARRQEIAIGLDWARRAGVNIPETGAMKKNVGRAKRIGKRITAQAIKTAVGQALKKQ